MEQNNHNNQKKIALINDFSGFGRCSLTVSIPIVSYLGIQACPIPTSLFSNHTGFESFYYKDLTLDMPKYINEWQKIGLQYNGIATGFLGSINQIEIVSTFIKKYASKDTIILIDPVMGDFGKIYPTYTTAMCNKIKELCSYADILTPNITEACILTDNAYKSSGWTYSELKEIATKLQVMGAKNIVISGIEEEETITNVVLTSDGKYTVSCKEKVGQTIAGTGDVFSSIIIADAVNNIPLDNSVQKAETFIQNCLKVTKKLNIPDTDGVCFEEILYTLERGKIEV